MRVKLVEPAALGLCLAALMGGTAARADWQECYRRCSLAKEGQCVEYATSCTNHRTGGGGSGAASYGAIAFSAGAFGYSDNRATRAEAEAEALKQCGQQACVVATWFFNNCGALATSSNGPWGAEHAPSAERAQALARARCAREGGSDCEIKVSHCSP
jgi:hypothetical protein